MKRKKSGDVFAFLERIYPLFFSILICIIYNLCKYQIVGDIGDLLNAIISLTSIVLGFLGVILALLFSFVNNPLLDYIMKNEYYKKKMKFFFKAPIMSGFVLVVCSVIMLSKISVRIDLFVFFHYIMENIKYLEIFFLVYFMLSSYRIINFVLKCAFEQKSYNNNTEYPDDICSEAELEKLREECSLNKDDEH